MPWLLKEGKGYISRYLQDNPLPKVKVIECGNDEEQEDAADEPAVHESATGKSEIMGNKGNGVGEEKGQGEQGTVREPYSDKQQRQLHREDAIVILASANFVVV